MVMPKTMTVVAITEDGVLGGTIGELDEEMVELLPLIGRPSQIAIPLPQCGG